MSDLAPRMPSAYELETVVSTFQQLTDRLLADPELIHDEDVLAFALASRDSVGAMLDGLIRCEVWAERRIDEADTERDYWVSRKARYIERFEYIRNTILAVMEAVGTKQHRGVERMATLSAPRNPIGIREIDPDKLPDEYVEIVRKPRRAMITADINQGVVIEGVITSNNPPILTMRRT
jgi:hypothetical protein